MEPMHTTRELIVIGPTGNPVLDMDPVDVANNGAVASAWDVRLQAVLAAMDEYADESGVTLQLVWSDTRELVLVECPTCQSVTVATSYAMPGDDDCLVCSDCLSI